MTTLLITSDEVGESKKENNLKLFNSLFCKIISLITKGIQSWVDAGEIIVNLIDNHNLTTDEITECLENKIPHEIVIRMEQLGRKKLIPELFVLNCPAASYGFLLPYQKQKELIIDGTPVEVLIFDVNEAPQSLRIQFGNLTPLQCKQVFDKGNIRDLAKQRAWFEAEKQKARIKTVPKAFATYEIIGNAVVVNLPCRFTKGELTRMIKSLK